MLSDSEALRVSDTLLRAALREIKDVPKDRQAWRQSERMRIIARRALGLPARPEISEDDHE